MFNLADLDEGQIAVTCFQQIAHLRLHLTIIPHRGEMLRRKHFYFVSFLVLFL